jgi:hypothetical protein
MESMRFLATFLLFAVAPLFAQRSEEKDVLAAVQKLFDAMAAKDAAGIRSAMLPDSRLYSVRPDAGPAGTPVEDFATRIAGSKEDLLERFTGSPKVSVHGGIAEVWSEYEFLRGGKFHHCGIDTATLFKTPSGWIIASLAFTSETTGCKGH